MLDGALFLPNRLPEQKCPRCGNNFPGGLKRCTACGLDITKAYKQPGTAGPWPGYEQGLIICRRCNFANSDDTARRGKIQKCDQCGQVVYIPSGLYSSHNPGFKAHQRKRQPLPRPLFFVTDLIGAALTRFYRSKIKWFLLFLIVVGCVGALIALAFFKNNNTQVVEVEAPVKTYYNAIVPLRGQISQSIDNFKLDAGNIPVQKDYNYWRTPTIRDRFTRACDRVLRNIEETITIISVMDEKQLVPPEAKIYQSKLLASLVARQKYYARLKDGIEKNDQKLWDSAFDMKNELSDAASDEVAALENLRELTQSRPNVKK